MFKNNKEKLVSILVFSCALSQAQSISDYPQIDSFDSCEKSCLSRGKQFCTSQSYSFGYCCSSKEDCPPQILATAPICAKPTDDTLIQKFVCPKIEGCGPQKTYTAQSDSYQQIEINPFTNGLKNGEICGYAIQTSDYKSGDHIEITSIDYEAVQLYAYHGGYSIQTAVEKVALKKGTKYVFEATGTIFLMTRVKKAKVNDKPYFSLQFKQMFDAERGAKQE